MSLAKWLIFGGASLILLGILVWFGLPLGKLSGDFQAKGEKYGIYFPIMTSIILSIILTVVLNAFFWLMRK